MITGDIKSQVDRIWDAFWSGGISNPLEVMEQITYLLFLRRLDELETLEENKAKQLGTPMERRIFPKKKDPKGRSYDELRWSRFKNAAPPEMLTIVGEHVFPFLRTLGGDGSTYAQHMKDARFTIPNAALPPAETQKLFARQIESVGSLKAAHRTSLAAMDSLFASLQDRSRSWRRPFLRPLGARSSAT